MNSRKHGLQITMHELHVLRAVGDVHPELLDGALGEILSRYEAERLHDLRERVRNMVDPCDIEQAKADLQRERKTL